jgi:hypothetical protein
MKGKRNKSEPPSKMNDGQAIEDAEMGKGQTSVLKVVGGPLPSIDPPFSYRLTCHGLVDEHYLRTELHLQDSPRRSGAVDTQNPTS